MTTQGNPGQGNISLDRPRGGHGQFVRSLETAERDAQACRLRSAGLTYAKIAEQLGFASAGNAYGAVIRALRDVVEESVEQLRTLEVMWLDRLQAAIWPAALAGDLKAVDRVVRIVDRRCKLLGLDSVEKIQVLTMDVLQAEITRLEKEVEKELSYQTEEEA